MENWAKIIIVDSRRMTEVEDSSVHLIVTSPPYWSIKNYGTRRIIKMFSFVGETVLDPFLGSGTTVKVALELERNAIGYEINEEDMIVQKCLITKLSLSRGLKILPQRALITYHE